VGLLIRMAPLVNQSATEQGPAFKLSTQEALGVVAMVVSAATYAALGVVYEVRPLMPIEIFMLSVLGALHLAACHSTCC
jgi:hypothetical protein